MSGAGIAAEVLAGLQEAAAATGPAITFKLVQRGAATGDAHNPTPGAETEHTCTAILSDYKDGQIDGTLIQQGDTKALVGTMSVVPEAGDAFFAGPVRYSVVRVKRVRPAGVDVMYQLQLRETGT